MNFHTKIVPVFFKTGIIAVSSGFFILILAGISPRILSAEGISHYYARYDIKYSKNRITDTRLVMVPSKNEFRAEKFSWILTAARANRSPGTTMEKMALDARNAAIISVLEKHGLTSVETRDLDTVVSYEGAVIMPVAVTRTDCGENRDGACTITARVLFSPISFPDRWPEQQLRFKIHRFFKDLFSVFD